MEQQPRRLPRPDWRPEAPSLGQLASRYVQALAVNRPFHPDLYPSATAVFGAATLMRITQDSTPRGKNTQVLASRATPRDRLRSLTSAGSRKNEVDTRSRSQTRIRGSARSPPPTRDLRSWRGRLRRSTTQSAHTSSGMQHAYRPGEHSVALEGYVLTSVLYRLSSPRLRLRTPTPRTYTHARRSYTSPMTSHSPQGRCKPLLYDVDPGTHPAYLPSLCTH